MDEEVKCVAMAYICMMNQIAVCYEEENKYKQKKVRQCWAKSHLLERDEYGHGTQLCNKIINDHETYFNFTRMTVDQFDKLLGIVGPGLAKFSIRKPISERVRILVTLRFLATGESYSSLGYAFRMAKCTIHNIVKETTQLIWSELNKEYIKKPTMEQLKQMAEDFYHNTGMPNCCGAIDGKHCVIRAPPNSGSLYFNYKKTFSIVLLAVCDSRYNFTYANVGAFGSESDGGILRRSEWGRKLYNNELQLPEDAPLPNTDTPFPYYFVGDEAFPLKRHLLRPYGGRGLSTEKRNFNTRLSRARRLIENSFGILAAKFRIYHTVICASPEVAESIVLSTVVLHNFIRMTRTTANAPPLTADEVQGSGIWNRPTQEESARPTHEAQQLRDKLATYLISH